MGSQFNCRAMTYTPVVDCPPPTVAELELAGYLIVTQYAGVHSDGTGDSWTGIQDCINDAYAGGNTVWFPYGTYIISKPLQCYEWSPWSGTGPTILTEVHNLQGEWRAGNLRPLIKLHATAALFDNTGAICPMIGFRRYEATISSQTSPGTPPANPMTLPASWASDEADLYSCMLRGIDFDTNGHVGAVGVHMPGAQWNLIERVKVTSTNSWASFAGLPAVGSITVNIEGVGGQYGICNTNDTQGDNGAGWAVTGLKLTGHTVKCIEYDHFTSPTITGFDISPAAGGVVWAPTTESSRSAYGGICFIDGKVSQATGTVFDNTDQGKNVYIRNVYVTGGTSNLIQSLGSALVTGSGTWKRIVEYSFCYQSAVHPPYADPSYVFDNYNVIDGSKTTTREVVNSITSSSSAPPTNLITQHYPDPFETIDTGCYVNITAYGAVRNTPLGTVDEQLDSSKYFTAVGEVDCLSAFNQAIAAAAAAGHNRVFVPRGAYMISGTLTLGAHTKLFGMGQRVSNIAPWENWRPQTGSPYLIDTVADTEGTAMLGSMTLAIVQISGTLAAKVYPGNRFSHIKWRVGRKSVTCHIRHRQQFVSVSSVSDGAAADKFQLDITSTGGGRHYAISSGSHQDLTLTASRLVRITGTTQSSAFYGINPELCKQNAAYSTAVACLEVKDSSNVRFTNLKREGQSGTLLIDNSSNVAAFGGGGMANSLNASPAYFYRILTGCTKILVCCTGTQKYFGQSEPLLSEQESGTTVIAPDGLALYKRGDIDDAAMVFT